MGELLRELNQLWTVNLRSSTFCSPFRISYAIWKLLRFELNLMFAFSVANPRYLLPFLLFHWFLVVVSRLFYFDLRWNQKLKTLSMTMQLCPWSTICLGFAHHCCSLNTRIEIYSRAAWIVPMLVNLWPSSPPVRTFLCSWLNLRRKKVVNVTLARSIP